MKMCLKSRTFKSYLCEFAIKVVLLSFLIKIGILLLSICRHKAVVYLLVTTFSLLCTSILVSISLQCYTFY